MRLALPLLLVEAGLVAQALLTDDGTGIPEQGRWGWLVLGTLLLLAVACLRSRLARAALVLGAFTGTILYAVNVPPGFPNAAWFTAVYALQAIPLLTPPVRAWTDASTAG